MVPSGPIDGEFLILLKPCQNFTSPTAGAPVGNRGPSRVLCPLCRGSWWNIGQGVSASWASAGGGAGGSSSAPESSGGRPRRLEDRNSVTMEAQELKRQCWRSSSAAACDGRVLFRHPLLVLPLHRGL